MLVRLITSSAIAAFVLASPITLQASAQTAQAATPAGWKEQSILGDRLHIVLPPEANIEGRQYGNIMATADPAETKTRARIPIAGSEIVVQAQSLDALAPANMLASIKESKYLSSFTGKMTETSLNLGGGWTAAAVFPERYQRADSYVLAYTWVRSPDGLLYEVIVASWFAEDKYAPLSAAAASMVKSLKPGKFYQEIPERVFKLDSEVPLRNENVELVITLDGKHLVSTEKGISFVVHRITSLVEYGEESGEMGIYLGRYPSFTPERELQNGARPESDPNQIFGKAPTWYVRTEDGWIKKSAILDVLSATTELKVHMFISGSPEQVERMVQLARTLKFRPKQ